MTDLDQIETIDDYFREFSHFHVKKATELLDPLHVPGRDPLPDFSDLTRQPFEPQAHVIAAAIKMLGATHRGMIVAECGTGKTLMGMLTLHEHAQRSVRKGGCNGNYRTIVLCPDHLITKWRDELDETIPGVKVTMFDVAGKGCKYLISDMNRLYDQVRGPDGRWRSRRARSGTSSAAIRPSSCRHVRHWGTSASASATAHSRLAPLAGSSSRSMTRTGKRSDSSLGAGSARPVGSRSWTRTARPLTYLARPSF